MKPAATRPDPTRNEVWDAFWAGKQSTEIYPAVSDILGEILRVLPDVRGRQVLEVGAGTGREGHELAESRKNLICATHFSWRSDGFATAATKRS